MLMFRNVCTEFQAGIGLHRSLDFVVLQEGSLMTNIITFGSFENFAMKVVEFQLRL